MPKVEFSSRTGHGNNCRAIRVQCSSVGGATFKSLDFGRGKKATHVTGNMCALNFGEVRRGGFPHGEIPMVHWFACARISGGPGFAFARIGRKDAPRSTSMVVKKWARCFPMAVGIWGGET